MDPELFQAAESEGINAQIRSANSEAGVDWQRIRSLHILASYEYEQNGFSAG